jgi:hypothetical protein
MRFCSTIRPSRPARWFRSVVELLDRPDQADVALLQEVEEAHPAADVLLRDRHDEAQVR